MSSNLYWKPVIDEDQESRRLSQELKLILRDSRTCGLPVRFNMSNLLFLEGVLAATRDTSLIQEIEKIIEIVETNGEIEIYEVF